MSGPERRTASADRFNTHGHTIEGAEFHVSIFSDGTVQLHIETPKRQQMFHFRPAQAAALGLTRTKEER